MKKILLLISLVMLSSVAKADCFCACVNGEYQAVCEKSWEFGTHYCGFKYCPLPLNLI